MTRYHSVSVPGKYVVIRCPQSDVSIKVDETDGNWAQTYISLADFHAAAFEVLGPDVVQPPLPPTPDEVKPGQVWQRVTSYSGEPLTELRVEALVGGHAWLSHVPETADPTRDFYGSVPVEKMLNDPGYRFVRDEGVTS